MNVKVCEADGLLRYLKPVLLALFATFVASGKDVAAQIAGNVEGGAELRVCKVHASVSAAVEDVRANIIARFLSPEGLLRDYEGELPTPADCHASRLPRRTSQRNRMEDANRKWSYVHGALP